MSGPRAGDDESEATGASRGEVADAMGARAVGGGGTGAMTGVGLTGGAASRGLQEERSIGATSVRWRAQRIDRRYAAAQGLARARRRLTFRAPRRAPVYGHGMTLRAALREPLLHFLLLGLALFFAHRVMGRGRPSEADARIVVDAQVRQRLAERFTATRGHEPTSEEMTEIEARWVDEEVLYRAGLERGLEREDPRIHERVADKMRFVLQSSVEVPQPTAGELADWWQQHKARWARPALLDFTHVFVEGDDAASRARANELLALLQAGAEPAGLGSRFSGGRHYRQRSVESLSEAFGTEFVDGLAAQPEGTWRLRRSRHGLHLVRVERKTAPTTSDFEASKLDVEKDWKDARRARAVQAALEQLRTRWPVERRK